LTSFSFLLFNILLAASGGQKAEDKLLASPFVVAIINGCGA